MKKMLKSTLGIAAAVAITGAAVTPAVLAWGDNMGGRPTYSLKQINEGAIDDKIVLNSIVTNDSELTPENIANGDVIAVYDERNFVGAREDDGDKGGKNNLYQNNEITVEEGKTYIIQLFVHNDNRFGEKMVAKDVTTSVVFQDYPGTTFQVDGVVTSSNATPSKFWDSVVFKSNNGQRFYLDYIEGSALLENGGKANGSKLGDEIISNGVKIGYDALDGNIPGCYKYSQYVTLKVKPVFEGSTIQKQVRLNEDDEWQENVHAKVGDTVEYQIRYKNLNNSQVNNVGLIDSLPDNMEYVKGSTKLYNSLYPKGVTNTNDTIATTGINIGHYAVNAQAVVRFKAKVTDKNLVCGNNQLVNWAKIGSDTVGYAVQDSANVYVEKTCQPDEPEKPVEPEKPTPETPETPKTPEKTTTTTTTKTTTTVTPSEMPSTGPVAATATALGAGSVVTAAGYFLTSRKQLRK